MWLGTLPSTRRLPCIPRLPTTMRSAPTASATERMALAGWAGDRVGRHALADADQVVGHTVEEEAGVVLGGGLPFDDGARHEPRARRWWPAPGPGGL